MTELQKIIVDKLQDERNLWVLATVTEDGKPWVRYVHPTRVDYDLTIWVATFADSRKVGQIRANPEVHLTTGVNQPGPDSSYVQVQGRAELLTDPEFKQYAWNDEAAAYFTGPDDPGYIVIKINPYRIELQSMNAAPPDVLEL